MGRKGYNQYGAYIWANIYYWKKYLEDGYEERERIRVEINSKDANSAEVSKIFYQKGWQYVSDQANEDQETENDIAGQEDYDDRMSNYNEFSSKNDSANLVRTLLVYVAIPKKQASPIHSKFIR